MLDYLMYILPKVGVLVGSLMVLKVCIYLLLFDTVGKGDMLVGNALVGFLLLLVAGTVILVTD